LRPVHAPIMRGRGLPSQGPPIPGSALIQGSPIPGSSLPFYARARRRTIDP
jgi:hypothetical protein